MADIVNLRRARKRHARAEKQARAEENRRKHGESKADRLARERAAARREADLSGKRLPPEEPIG